MTTELKTLIDNNELSEMELIEFISTLKKLSNGNVLDTRNYKLVLDHFGLKKKKGRIKFDKGVKYKIR